MSDAPESAAARVPLRPEVEARLREILAEVCDPEIPVLSVVDLGIIRSLTRGADDCIRVGVSPTYSGCPATDVIKRSIARALREAGFAGASCVDEFSPPWSSDCISEAGRRKLRDYGIAPPVDSVSSARELLRPAAVIACPRCGSVQTTKLSEFGSTPCKALYRCTSCLEPFDYFKCI
jgi:ring-1,2-phenylacetyl-CoA epoxidase subunit PaaD